MLMYVSYLYKLEIVILGKEDQLFNLLARNLDNLGWKITAEAYLLSITEIVNSVQQVTATGFEPHKHSVRKLTLKEYTVFSELELLLHLLLAITFRA